MIFFKWRLFTHQLVTKYLIEFGHTAHTQSAAFQPILVFDAYESSLSFFHCIIFLFVYETRFYLPLVTYLCTPLLL